MKIQGSNPLINAYRNQQQKHVTKKDLNQKDDQLNISQEAKNLQKSDTHSMERTKHVAEIKKLVQSGEYKIDFDKTAQKMIDFWAKQ